MDIDNIKDKIIHIQGQQEILDTDVASLYGVETKRVNEAVKNNPNKFPEGYIIYLSDDEADSLRSKFSTLKNPGRGGHFKYSPKAFYREGSIDLLLLLSTLKNIYQSNEVIKNNRIVNNDGFCRDVVYKNFDYKNNRIKNILFYILFLIFMTI